MTHANGSQQSPHHQGCGGVVRHLAAFLVLVLGWGLVTGVSTVVSLAVAGWRDQPAGRGIAVSGTAATAVAPDRAEVTLGFEVQAPTAREAQEKNAQAMERVLDALKQAGVAAKDVRTSGYNLSPVRRWDEKANRDILVGYQAVNQVTAATSRPAEVGELIDRAVAAGANSVPQVEFIVTGRAKVCQETLAKAVADAHRQAERMAKAAGVKLGKLRSLNEATAETAPPFAAYKDVDAARNLASTPVEPGETRFTTTVQAVYEVK